MNLDYLEGKWQKAVGKARQHWSELTDDELGNVQGRFEQLAGLLQEKYGYTREKAEEEIHSWVSEVESSANTAATYLDQTVGENRWTALATTLVAGFAIGLLVGHNMETS